MQAYIYTLYKHSLTYSVVMFQKTRRKSDMSTRSLRSASYVRVYRREHSKSELQHNVTWSAAAW
jgi:hypothetical protein